jgi:predicted lactoylglutathione lyase
MHLDLTVRTREELDAAHVKVINLGGELLLDRTQSVEEPLRVYADLDGHPFCIFVFDEH